MLWLFLSPAARADDLAPLVLAGDSPSYALAGHLAAYTGDDGSDTVQDAEGRPFSSAIPPITTGTLWLRFRVIRSEAEPARWILAFGEPDMDDVRVYVPGAGGGYDEVRLGRRIPNDELSLAARLHVARLDLPENRPVTIYLRLASQHKIRLEDAALWHPAALVQQEARQSALYGLHMGALLVLAVVAGLFGVWLRDGTIIAFALYVAAMLCRGMVHTGLAALIFPTAGGVTNYLLSGLGLLGGAASLLLMWDRILDLRFTSPVLHRLFLAAIGAVCLGFLLVLHPAFSMVVMPVQVLMVAGGAVAVVLAVRRAWQDRGDLLVRIYLLAFAPVVLGWGVELMARVSSAVPAGLGRAMDIGSSILHVGLLSIALAYRLHLLRRARLEAEMALAGERLSRQRQQTFIDMVSHEFKTPLAVIDSSAQLMAMDGGEQSPDLKERLAVIRGAVRRLVKLIETCLADDRQAELALRLHPMVPEELLQRVAARNWNLDRADLALHVADLPDRCVADAELLGIALDALVDNARRYGPPGQVVEIAGRHAGGCLELVVADRGPGVPPDDAERIFEKHFRGRNSEGIPGTGIGLHLVKAVADMHGGRVTCRSRDGGGSEFILAVPLRV